MAQYNDKRSDNKPAPYSRLDLSSIRIETGVYIGIVKNNLDDTKKGRLQVFIPDLGGDPDDARNWRPVDYASPFMGSTYPDNQSIETTFNTVNNTYGFWMVPPDIDAQVLVTFVGGRADKGYWFACVSPHVSHNMIPGLAATPAWSGNKVRNELPDDIQKQVSDGNQYPTVEFNENNEDLRKPGYLTKNERPLHRTQFSNLVNQGLQNDPIRGTTTSSSQREAPSSVFGFSSPGRPLPDTKDNAELLEKLARNEATVEDIKVTKRQGGHSFVLDDGTVDGKDQQIRLRTAGGHQIVMHDSGQTMYISNSNGSVWIELSNSGQMHIFSSNGLNVRTQGDLNLHADRDINIHSNANINMKAANGLRIESQSTDMSTTTTHKIYASNIEGLASQNISLQASQILENSGSPISVPDPIPIKELEDVKKNPNTGVYESLEKTLTSIVTVAPTHEPFSRKAGTTVNASIASTSTTYSNSAAQGNADGEDVNQQDPNVPELSEIECMMNSVVQTSSGVLTTSDGTPVGTGSSKLDPGPSSAIGKPLKTKLSISKFKEQPTPIGGIGPLSVSEVRAVMGQLGWKESTWNYAALNSFGYAGKYQFGAAALVDRGYIRREYFNQYKNAALTVDLAWTGKNGINNRAAWLANTQIQEQVMYEQLRENYNRMVQNGGIKVGDDKCCIAGMLCVAHLLGPNKGTDRPGALGWRLSGVGTDANGTGGSEYYNYGRYAIDVLAKGT